MILEIMDFTVIRKEDEIRIKDDQSHALPRLQFLALRSSEVIILLLDLKKLSQRLRTSSYLRFMRKKLAKSKLDSCKSIHLLKNEHHL